MALVPEEDLHWILVLQKRRDEEEHRIVEGEEPCRHTQVRLMRLLPWRWQDEVAGGGGDVLDSLVLGSPSNGGRGVGVWAQLGDRCIPVLISMDECRGCQDCIPGCQGTYPPAPGRRSRR